MKTLVLGGIKSGKSRFAESLATQTDMHVVYIATATAGDDEMRQRIMHHRDTRPSHWQLIEEPICPGEVIAAHASKDSCILVDCLTLWMTNLLLTSDDELLKQQKSVLLESVKTSPAPIILVGNETSMGVVPLGELTRRYCDEAGLLHQELAAACDTVVLTVAGLPTWLKGSHNQRELNVVH